MMKDLIWKGKDTNKWRGGGGGAVYVVNAKG